MENIVCRVPADFKLTPVAAKHPRRWVVISMYSSMMPQPKPPDTIDKNKSLLWAVISLQDSSSDPKSASLVSSALLAKSLLIRWSMGCIMKVMICEPSKNFSCIISCCTSSLRLALYARKPSPLSGNKSSMNLPSAPFWLSKSISPSARSLSTKSDCWSLHAASFPKSIAPKALANNPCSVVPKTMYDMASS